MVTLLNVEAKALHPCGEVFLFIRNKDMMLSIMPSAFELNASGKAEVLSSPSHPLERMPGSGVRPRQMPQNIQREVIEAIERIMPSHYASSRRDEAASDRVSKVAVPHLVARGNEHLVFAFEERKYQGLIFKVNFSKSLRSLHLVQRGESGKRYARDLMQRQIAEYQHDIEEIRKEFGRGALPPERIYVDDVPVSREVIELLFKAKIPEEMTVPETLPVWVVLQRKIELPEADQVISLTGGYPERQASFRSTDSKEAAEYEQTHNLLVGNKSTLSPEEQCSSVLRMYPSLRVVALQMQRDLDFVSVLQDAVRKMISYMQKTDMVLDLAGKNNIALVKTPKGWELKMLDPLPPRDWRISDLDQRAEDLHRQGRLTTQQALDVMNILNTIRVTNALAELSGIQERLRPRLRKPLSAETWREQLLAQAA